jgi:hypothetical protein
MKLGVSGHRWRDGADWEWVRREIESLIIRIGTVSGLTSLAPGADRVFADAILARGKDLVSIAPAVEGVIDLERTDKAAFDRYAARSVEIIRVEGATPDEAFLRAGERVADDADYMVFVWDGRPSRGSGGTADIVAYARAKGKTGIILDPVLRTSRDLYAAP